MKFDKTNLCPFQYGRPIPICKSVSCAWWDREKEQCILFTIADALKGGAE